MDKHPRLNAAMAQGNIEFNGIRYKEQREPEVEGRSVWHLIGFEGDEDSIERLLVRQDK